MNSPTRSRVFRRTAALAACAALTLAGCGTVGHDDIPVAEGNGAYANIQSLLVRNMFILGPPPAVAIPRDGQAALFLNIVNNGPRPDRLVRVAAPGVAKDATIEGGGLDAPVRQLVPLGPTPRVMLTKLAAPLRGNQTVRVTLTFRDAGPISVDTPVVTYAPPYTTYSPTPAPTGTPKR